MSILCIGDPHFQINNTEECESALVQILDYIDQYNPMFVVVLGDLLHTHEKIHISPYKLITKFLKEISSKALTYVLIGNHDYINNQQFLSDNHAFNAFKYWENLIIVDRVIREELNGFQFVFCPYVPPGRFEEALSTLPDFASAHCIFAHQEFYGCSFNPVMESTEGDHWPVGHPLVISGHIHTEQRPQNNIYYTGSLLQTSFAETEEKIILLYTPDSETFTRLPIKSTRKKVFYREISEFDAFLQTKLEKGVEYKLVLKGTHAEYAVLKKTEKYKKLAKMIKITFLAISGEVVIHKTQQKGILNILKELLVKEDGLVQEAYRELVAKS